MKEGYSYLMNDDSTQSNYDLEKMIRKSTKIAKEKYIAIQAREKRKLRIKEKKYFLKQDLAEKDNELL